jgi:hypothetical protein
MLLAGFCQDLAGKRKRLRALVQLVCLAEVLEDDIEAVEERDPMVEVASREGPSRWEGCEVSWEEGEGDGAGRAAELLQVRRLE